MARHVARMPFACLMILTVTACSRTAEEGSARETVAAISPDSATTDAHAAAARAAEGSGGQALLPIMQQLGADMMALTHALMTDDYATVTQRAEAVANHAPISAEDLERIHGLLVNDMAQFEALDESVHEASVRLHEAAQARQPRVIAERLGEVQQGCVACHVQFRERLRTNRGG